MRYFTDGTMGCETNSVEKDFQVCFTAFPIRSNYFFNKIRIIGNPLNYNKCLKCALANLALIGRQLQTRFIPIDCCNYIYWTASSTYCHEHTDCEIFTMYFKVLEGDPYLIKLLGIAACRNPFSVVQNFPHFLSYYF